MTKSYTTGHTEINAKNISRGLYSLLAGEEVGGIYTTEFLLFPFKHPVSDDWALEINPDQIMIFNRNQDPDPAALINYYKALGEITPQEETGFRAKCFYGNTITLSEIIPAATALRFKTFTQMLQDGWIAAEAV